jgi:hypothetical protein
MWRQQWAVRQNVDSAVVGMTMQVSVGELPLPGHGLGDMILDAAQRFGGMRNVFRQRVKPVGRRVLTFHVYVHSFLGMSLSRPRVSVRLFEARGFVRHVRGTCCGSRFARPHMLRYQRFVSIGSCVICDQKALPKQHNGEHNLSGERPSRARHAGRLWARNRQFRR